MTRQQLLDKRDFFNLVHGITLRAIETFADNELDFRPKPGMRTPRFGTYPAWQYLVFASDEHWHHRGPLCTNICDCGREPPMLYDYQVG